MTCEVIATGSKGNALLLGGNLLIDCGVPFRALEGVCQALSIVALTHIHGDHFRPETVRQLHRLRPALRFLCPPWLLEPLSVLGVSRRVVDFADTDCRLDYGAMGAFEMTPIPHDVDNCAWHIFRGGERAFYATDCGSLDGVSAPGYDLYLIEANYGEAEIQERMQKKLAAGEFSHESRVMDSHLSREQAAAWLAANAAPGKSKVLFLHQHESEGRT